MYQVKQALEECRKHASAVLVFPAGRYDFWYGGAFPGSRLSGVTMQA
ncbi:MAG: hypothetical protein LBC47_00275 [Tannerella sp.]|nr:hypothetical protein [Tannerella sp.]